MAVFAKEKYIFLALSIVTICNGLDLSDKCRDFSHKIVNITTLGLGKVNTVLSPFQMWNLLFSVALAANGDTARKVFEALGISHENENSLIKATKALNKEVLQNDSTDAYCTSEENLFWDKNIQINSEFQAIINYGLEIENEMLDFSNSTSATAIDNSLIASTRVKDELQNVLHGEYLYKSRMILIFSMPFEGSWTLPFNALDTAIEPFYSEKGDIIRQVYMMSQRNKFPFSNIRELSAFALELSYGANDKYCMLILLPSPDTNVNEVYQKLVHSFTLEDVIYRLNNDTKNYGLENIDIKIPRFEIKRNSEWNQLHKIFDPQLADFSRVTSDPIFVSKIEHRVNINVTESGTSAYVSTSAVFTAETIFTPGISGTRVDKTIKSDPIYSPAFIANRPFIYYVTEKSTKTIIFGGVLSEQIVF